MIIKSLTLKDFKSYKSETFSFHDRFNLILGENAQGKTNLLEAIYFLLTFKPFKQLRTDEVITIGSKECRLKGEILSSSGFDEVHIHLDENHKTVKLNGKIVYKTSNVYGRYNVVSFLPTDLELIKGSPQIRRRYIDSVISTLEDDHLRDLKLYQKALSQRNAVLSKTPSLTPDKIEVWDEKLAEFGCQIISRRLKFIDIVKPHINRIYSLTSGLNHNIEIYYKSSIIGSAISEKDFVDTLRLNFDRDKKRLHTTVGPQRDQINFSIEGNDASSYSSQGEAKNLAFALKASEIDMTKEYLNKTPILLLDDVTSELDANRKKYLFKLLREFPGQIFITTTDMNEIMYNGQMRVLYLKDKKVNQKLIQT